MLDEYTVLVKALLAVNKKVVDQKTTGGLGKVVSGIAILQAAQEGAARLRGFGSGILAAKKPLNDKEDLFLILNDHGSVAVNLTSPALSLSDDSQNLVKGLLANQDWRLVEQAVLDIVDKAGDGLFATRSDAFWNSSTKIVDALNGLVQDEIKLTLARADKTRKDFFYSFVLLIAVTAGLILLLTALGLAIIRSISKPMTLISATFSSIAEGEGGP